MSIEQLKKINIGYTIAVLDGNFGKLYIDFILLDDNHYEATLFLKRGDYLTVLEKKPLSYWEFEKLVTNIREITSKVTCLCEKTSDEFIEEFWIDRPSNDLEQDTDTEEFNLIIYSVEVGSANSYGDSWYMDVFTTRLETELTADDYDKEELCKVLHIKHDKFMKKLPEIVFSSTN